MSDLEIRMTPLADIRPYDKNPRNNRAAIPKVAASIKEFGFRQPIVVDKHGVIIAGHTRFLAAQSLGLDEAPVHWAMNLTQAQARAYRIADNRTHEEAEWDFDVLAEELKALQADPEAAGSMDALGFDPLEFQRILDGEMGAGGGQAAAANKLAEEFGIAPFSVMNAREGWWQDRKDAWIGLGIQSELGRGDENYHAVPGRPGNSPNNINEFAANLAEGKRKRPRGATPPHPPTVFKNPDGTLNYGGTEGQASRFNPQRRRPNAAPGGSLMPAINPKTGKIARADNHGRIVPGTDAK